MITGSALLAMGVGVAQAAPPASDATTLSEIIVTGSRIKQPNLTSVSPVNVVSAKEIKLTGTTNVESLLNQLPQVFADQTGGASNGASGTATVDLRDLGPVRTLVLMDGTRLPPADAAQPTADLDTVPTALVDRVEVLTGGASATYGSDALAGVVNFIMKKDLEGVRLDAQYGFAQHHQHDGTMQGLERVDPLLTAPVPVPGDKIDGFTKDITVAIGSNTADGKGNVTAYVGYRVTDAVTQAERDYSACALLTNNGDGAHYCLGSSGTPLEGRFKVVGPLGNPNIANNPASGSPQDPLFGPPTGPAQNRSNSWYGHAGGQLSAIPTVFNFAPYNYLQRPQERYSAGAFAHYDINNHLEVYSNFMFTDNHTDAVIAPSGLFYGQTYAVNCGNPFLTGGPQGSHTEFCTGLAPNQFTNLFIGRRTTELGPRQDDLRHTSYRMNIGAKGDLADGWSYDAYAQYGNTIYQERYSGEVSISRATKALDVVLVGGVPTCQSVVDGTDPACRPINIFTPGQMSAAGAAYIAGSGEKEGSSVEQIVSGSITGDLGRYGIKFPMATDGVSVALGSEYRREAILLNVDQAFSSGDLAGQGGQTASINGAYDVKEIFTEFRAPLVQKQPMIELLQFDGAARYSEYSNVGGNWTYKMGLEYAPTEDIRFRAGFNHAVRAPDTVELFSAPVFQLFSGNDPCRGSHGPVNVNACLATGATLGQLGTIDACPAAQCTQHTEGNPLLQPETSDTKTFGVVFTPSFFKGFSASVDYFDIDVTNLIGAYGAATIVNKCFSQYNTPNGAFFCQYIHRDPTTGDIFGTGYVENGQVNTGFLHTHGIDVAADYRLDTSMLHGGDLGSVDFSFAGTYLKDFEVQPSPKIGTYNCSGLYGATCGVPLPTWRHKLRATWNMPWDNVALSVQWRYLGAVTPDVVQSNPLLHNKNIVAGVGAPLDNIPAYNYFDLSATWRARDHVTFRAGVNNVFDKDPPTVDQTNFGLSSPPSGNGNGFPGTYDSLGRTFFVGFTGDF